MTFLRSFCAKCLLGFLALCLMSATVRAGEFTEIRRTTSYVSTPGVVLMPVQARAYVVSGVYAPRRPILDAIRMRRAARLNARAARLRSRLRGCPVAYTQTVVTVVPAMSCPQCPQQMVAPQPEPAQEEPAQEPVQEPAQEPAQEPVQEPVQPEELVPQESAEESPTKKSKKDEKKSKTEQPQPSPAPAPSPVPAPAPEPAELAPPKQEAPTPLPYRVPPKRED